MFDPPSINEMKNSSKLQVLEFIEDNLPPESATAYGLHINAELGFQCREASYFCTLLMLLQPREAIQEGGLRVEERAKIVLDEVLERLPEIPNLDEIRKKVEEPTPYTMVALQVLVDLCVPFACTCL
jgi:dynein heavy chain